MCGTNISKQILENYVDDILKFKKKFIGNTKNNSFCLVEDKSELPEYIKTKNIDNYYLRLKEPDKSKFYKYGFVDPNGNFFNVKWANHHRWASEYISTHYEMEEQLANYEYIGADFLVYVKGWILLHSPQQEIAKLEQGKPMTKAQKETLYDYYIFFGREKEANELYE